MALSTVRDASGQLSAISQIAGEFTKARQRHRALAIAADIIEHMDDAIIAKTLDGKVISWNAGAERLFGYSAHEMVGHSIIRLFPEERIHEETELIARLVAGKEVCHVKAQRLRKDGSTVDISVTLSPIHDATGSIIAISKIARDITALNCLQSTLEQATNDLQMILEHSPWMVSYWNTDFTNRFANTAYAQASGLTVEELRGRHIRDVFGAEIYERASPYLDEARRGIPQCFERATRLPGGRVRHDQVSYVPDVIANGEAQGIFVFVNDITASKLAEQALADSAARFQQLYETTPAVMHSIDAEGRLRAVSDHWLKKLGYSRAEVLGREFTDFLTVASQALFLTEHLAAFRDGKDDDCLDYQIICKSGQIIDVVLSAIAEHDAHGRFCKSMEVIEDVTARKAAERALRSSEEFLDRAGIIAGIGGWSFDLETQVIRWSDQTCRIREVEIGHHPTFDEALGYYAPESRKILDPAIERCMRTGDTYDLELTLVTAKGRPIWVRLVGESERRNGKAIRMFGSLQDITARKLVEFKLAEQYELMRVTLQSIGDAVITTDVNGLVQWLNPVAAQLTGWPIDEARGRSIDEVFNICDESTHLPVSSPVSRALSEDRSVGLPEFTLLVARDGTEHGIEDSAAPIRTAEGRSLGVVLVFHDVSKQRRLAKEVSFRASHDDLTGLLNRAEFEARLENALISAQHEQASHALMFIDLDQFKLVNDACGHAVGDQLLRQVSGLFKSIIRSHDTLGRLGGDEFGVIMEHCTVAQARRVAGQLCESIEKLRFVHEERRFRVGASVGLVPIDSRWTNTELLMQAADAACYAAKEGGRNRVHEWVDTDERMQERHWEIEWATRLEEALDDHGFRLYGQRIASCSATMAGLSLEVLLRLAKPDGTIITPAAFLPAAERFHMASRIDRWVVREILSWMGQISLEGVDAIAVNLSGQSIGDRSFHRYVIDLISRIPFDPCKLCFEITETAAITNLSDASEFIKAIRARGVRIALDDFGAGASSFGYLKHLTVDILKIDGQFVRDLLKDPLARTAVRCFRDVAQVCGLKTIAEFVESEEILAELRDIGVDFAQGYLIHRPEPLEHLLPARLEAVNAPLIGPSALAASF